MEGRALTKKLNLLNFHFYARLSYFVSLFYLRAYERNIIRDSGNQHPTSGDSVVAVSGTHARACCTTKSIQSWKFQYLPRPVAVNFQELVTSFFQFSLL